MFDRGGETAATDVRASTNVYRTLIKTLLKTGIITECTHTSFARCVDLDEITAEGDRMVGDDVAEAGIESLNAIKATKRRIVRGICA